MAKLESKNQDRREIKDQYEYYVQQIAETKASISHLENELIGSNIKAQIRDNIASKKNELSILEGEIQKLDDKYHFSERAAKKAAEKAEEAAAVKAAEKAAEEAEEAAAVAKTHKIKDKPTNRRRKTRREANTNRRKAAAIKIQRSYRKAQEAKPAVVAGPEVVANPAGGAGPDDVAKAEAAKAAAAVASGPEEVAKPAAEEEAIRKKAFKAYQDKLFQAKKKAAERMRKAQERKRRAKARKAAGLEGEVAAKAAAAVVSGPEEVAKPAASENAAAEKEEKRKEVEKVVAEYKEEKAAETAEENLSPEKKNLEKIKELKDELEKIKTALSKKNILVRKNGRAQYKNLSKELNGKIKELHKLKAIQDPKAILRDRKLGIATKASKEASERLEVVTASAVIAAVEKAIAAVEKAEAERVAAEKAKRIAVEQAEAKRVAAEKAKRIAAEQAEAKRVAAEKAEAKRIAAEQAEAKRIAAEQAEAKRVAAEKAKRIAAEQAEAERVAAEQAAAVKVPEVANPAGHNRDMAAAVKQAPPPEIVEKPVQEATVAAPLPAADIAVQNEAAIATISGSAPISEAKRVVSVKGKKPPPPKRTGVSIRRKDKDVSLERFESEHNKFRKERLDLLRRENELAKSNNEKLSIKKREELERLEKIIKIEAEKAAAIKIQRSYRKTEEAKATKEAVQRFIQKDDEAKKKQYYSLLDEQKLAKEKGAKLPERKLNLLKTLDEILVYEHSRILNESISELQNPKEMGSNAIIAAELSGKLSFAMQDLNKKDITNKRKAEILKSLKGYTEESKNAIKQDSENKLTVVLGKIESAIGFLDAPARAKPTPPPPPKTSPPKQPPPAPPVRKASEEQGSVVEAAAEQAHQVALKEAQPFQGAVATADGEIYSDIDLTEYNKRLEKLDAYIAMRGKKGKPSSKTTDASVLRGMLKYVIDEFGKKGISDERKKELTRAIKTEAGNYKTKIDKEHNKKTGWFRRDRSRASEEIEAIVKASDRYITELEQKNEKTQTTSQQPK